MADSQNSGHGAAAATPALDQKALQSQLANANSPEQCCAVLSRIFSVRIHEVALLRLESGLLRFLYPSELATVGSIPISSSTAVAAHTAVTRKVELFNNFTTVKHSSVFETIKPGGSEGEAARPGTIYKLMSAPILDGNDKVLGVLQISHKGFDLASAGSDFTLNDLQKVELVAKAVAQIGFMRQSR